MSTMSGLHLEQLQEVVEQQRAEIERLRLKVPDRDKLLAEMERLKEQVATCRELRKYDRIEIERMRILLDRKTP